MFAALYGRLVPHPWRGPEPEGDAYSLFYQRSLAMGWLQEGSGAAAAGTDIGAGGLWAMNDAGWEHPLAAADPPLAAWFQVDVGAVAQDRPLPVQPFLRCAGDATQRAGMLDLQAVQLLLPIQGLDASTPPPAPPSMLTTHWFRDSNPRSRVGVDVNISSGRHPGIQAAAGQLTAHLDRLDQNVFVRTSSETITTQALLAPPFHDRFWNGPALHGLMLRGELIEWGFDPIGWLGEVIADLSARLGQRSPLLLTVNRLGQPR